MSKSAEILLNFQFVVVITENLKKAKR